MPKYYIEAPILVKVMLEVDADSPDEAIDAMMDDGIHMEPVDKYDRFEYIDYEWEMHDKIVTGNVFHGSINQIEVTELEDEDDEDDE